MTQGDASKSTGPAADDGARRVPSVKGVKGDPAREGRIKAALKANIARRKVQARQRDDSEDDHE